jgi:hypothetical protein
LEELTLALDAGMTPIVSYWSGDMQWMDGAGNDGKGACPFYDTPDECKTKAGLANFFVHENARHQHGDDGDGGDDDSAGGGSGDDDRSSSKGNGGGSSSSSGVGAGNGTSSSTNASDSSSGSSTPSPIVIALVSLGECLKLRRGWNKGRKSSPIRFETRTDLLLFLFSVSGKTFSFLSLWD